MSFSDFNWEVAAIVVTAILGFYALRSSLYIRRREFEDIYVQRYWEINDRLPVEVRLKLMVQESHPFDVADEGTRRAIWDYLMLCEDEIDLRAHGQVTDETWSIWSDSITGSMKRYPYKQMFEWIESEFDVLDEGRKSAADRPFVNLRRIHQREIDEANFDPLKRSRLRNYLEGRRESLFFSE
ncbi:hypothetical protein [Corynebacterium sp. HMSC11E11]|uniref:hypothetical protein n=1 Tax=Corynebacterium sp. HMSC11E11 TaxID=1581089 RepID=UPI0008A41028|nr:hypothetical protein [Corynebacterium sp. HMSC11E11]OFU57155.1 hypothetical protein HMPREF3121_03555 [Corynebacterium sp. HMSC11E11]